MSRIKKNTTKAEAKALSLLQKDKFLKFLKKYKVQMLHNQDPGRAVPTFSEMLRDLNYSVTKTPNYPWEISYKYKASKGITKLSAKNKYSKDKPSLIFHHGIAATTPVVQLKILCSSEFFDKFNIFTVKTAHHDSLKDIFGTFTQNFVNFSSAITGSVIATQEAVKFHKNNSDRKVIVAGFSLGGVVTALHHFYFDSADYYFPIISYPNIGKILLHTEIKEFIANHKDLAKNESILKSFEIPSSLKEKNKEKVYPILAKFDSIINYEDAKKFWEGYEIKTLETGHFSAATAREEIREYVLGKIN